MAGRNNSNCLNTPHVWHLVNPDTLHMYVGYTDTLHVQWQFASSLSKSQSVISRTNSNSNLYYTLAYLGEPGEPAKESGAGAGREG